MADIPADSSEGADSRARPSVWQKRLLGLPAWLYAHGFGFLFGERLAVLVHRGRRTGLERRTVLEILEHRQVDGEYRVLAGWGRTSDWFRNLQAAPPIALWVGRRRLGVAHRELDLAETAAAVRHHLLIHPRVSARLHAGLWNALEAGENSLRTALRSTPAVAFRPNGEAVGIVIESYTDEGLDQ
jgi:deazaflavin-dependent oxidoreductase (nitroreductase family)